jgi:alpha 1,6-mannosyltransferase
VQWTLHSVPGHPVLIDVLRRLLEANTLFDAYKVELLRQAFAEASPQSLNKQKSMLDAADLRAGGSEDGEMMLQRLALSQKKSHPWTNIGMVWQYVQGAWRLGWHQLSVEEWTGPPVWTDAVFS